MSALKELQNLTYDEFAREHVLHGSAERDFQVAIQATLDIASIILSEQSVDVPESYAALFPKLSEIEVLPADLAQNLVNMAKFRNVLVHLYLEVDLKKVHHYLHNNLEDFELFTQYVSDYIETKE